MLQNTGRPHIPHPTQPHTHTHLPALVTHCPCASVSKHTSFPTNCISCLWTPAQATLFVFQLLWEDDMLALSGLSSLLCVRDMDLPLLPSIHIHPYTAHTAYTPHTHCTLHTARHTCLHIPTLVHWALYNSSYLCLPPYHCTAACACSYLWDLYTFTLTRLHLRYLPVPLLPLHTHLHHTFSVCLLPYVTWTFRSNNLNG